MRLVGGDAAYLAWRATVLELPPPVIPLWWAQAVSDGYCLHKDRVCSRIGSCCLPPPWPPTHIAVALVGVGAISPLRLTLINLIVL